MSHFRPTSVQRERLRHLPVKKKGMGMRYLTRQNMLDRLNKDERPISDEETREILKFLLRTADL